MWTALEWFWSLWYIWPDVNPCTCWIMWPTLLSCGLRVCDQHPCLLSYMSPPHIPIPHITCNSLSPFQSPCFLSMSHLSHTHSLSRPLLCPIWLQVAGLSPAHAQHFQHRCFSLPLQHTCNLLAVSTVTSTLQYCLLFMDWLHLTMKRTWTFEMSGATHPRIQCHLQKISALSVHIFLWLSLWWVFQDRRIHDLMNMSGELVCENYHGKDRVTQRKEEVLQCWEELLQLLDKNKTKLTMLRGLMALLREVDTVMATIAELQVGTSNLLWKYRLLRENFTSTCLQWVFTCSTHTHMCTPTHTTYTNTHAPHTHKHTHTPCKNAQWYWGGRLFFSNFNICVLSFMFPNACPCVSKCCAYLEAWVLHRKALVFVKLGFEVFTFKGGFFKQPPQWCPHNSQHQNFLDHHQWV